MKITKLNSFTVSIFLIISAIYACYSYLTPFQNDDFAFFNRYLYVNEDFSREFSFSQLFATFNLVREIDNGRLSNFLCVIVMHWCPKIIFSILTGFVTAGIFFLVAELSLRELKNKKEYRPWVFLFSWALSVFLFPWGDSIIQVDYALNYLYPSFLILLFCKYILDFTDGKKVKLFPYLGYLILAFITAWFHEGFSFGICFGLICLMIKNKGRLSKEWYGIVVMFFIGTAVAYFSGGTLNRIGNYIMSDSLPVKEMVRGMIFGYPLVTLSLIALLIAVSVRRGREYLKSLLSQNIWMLFVAASLVASVMAVLMAWRYGNRVGWPASLFILVIFQYLVAEFLLKYRTVKFIGLVISFCSIVFMLNVLYWTDKVNDEYNEVLDEYWKSETGTVYYDADLYLQVPGYTRGLVRSYVWRNQWTIGLIQLYLDYSRPFNIVASDLENFDSGKYKTLPGNGSVLTYKKHLVTRDTEPEIYRNQHFHLKWNVKAEDKNNETRESLVFHQQFISASGDTLIYLSPCNDDFLDWYRSHEIKQVDFIPLK